MHPDSQKVPLFVRDLTVAYHRKPVLWDVEFEIPEGKLVAIIGPNGAGKSTLLKACQNLVPKTSGKVLVYGQTYERQRHRIGYVPQRESVDWDFPINVLDTVTMGTYGKIGWMRPVRQYYREVAMNALRKVGIDHLAQRQISQLSGGQQQRVFLARALAQNADLYFMDEPFAAVDAATEQSIVATLRELQTKGKTCLIVHHDLATVRQYFDWVVLLNMRIVKFGPTAEVFNRENLRETYGGRLVLLEEALQQMQAPETRAQP